MNQLVYTQPPDEVSLNINEDIFYKCILRIIENQGLGKSCQFRDLLLEFKEVIEQYSFVEYEHDTNDIKSINSDTYQLETKLKNKFKNIKSFIQDFENSSDLIADIEQYQQLTQKFFQVQTSRQNGNLYTNLHVEWVIRISAINHYLESEKLKHDQQLTEKRGLPSLNEFLRLLGNRHQKPTSSEQYLIESPVENIQQKTSTVNKTALFIFCTHLVIVSLIVVVFSNKKY